MNRWVREYMPTKSGKLKAGDRLRNPHWPWLEFVVLERYGNHRGYSVRIARADGFQFRAEGQLVTAFTLDHAHARVFGRASEWRLTRPGEGPPPLGGGWPS